MNKNDYYFESIEILRAFAILLVLVSHFETRGFSEYNYWMWSGVDLFFLISGFLITSLWNIRGDGAKGFYIKRFFRIFPAYFLTLMAYFIIEVYVQKGSMDILKYLTFTQNFFGDQQFFHSWSLCVEEHFYLLFPLLIPVFNRYPVVALLIFLSQPLIRYTIIYLNPETLTDPNLNKVMIYMPTYTRLDGISLGVFLGVIYTKKRLLFETIISKKKTLLLVVLINALYLTTSIHLRESTYHAVMVYFSLSLLFGSIFLFIFNMKSNSIFKKISDLSYSSYLVHHLVQYVMTYLLFKFFKFNQEYISSIGLLLFVIYFFSTLLIAQLIKTFLEDKFISIGKTLSESIKGRRFL